MLQTSSGNKDFMTKAEYNRWLVRQANARMAEETRQVVYVKEAHKRGGDEPQASHEQDEAQAHVTDGDEATSGPAGHCHPGHASE